MFCYFLGGRNVSSTTAAGCSEERRFIYDGWNLISEVHGIMTPVVLARHIWGLDLSKTLQDGGGVGGLLGTVTASGTIPMLSHLVLRVVM